jgi:amino acid transporter
MNYEFVPEGPSDSDEKRLQSMGYAQELLRRMSGFSNYAISLSIICILAGGITSFHQGLCSVGGAAIGLGWPIVCTFSLIVAATMGQIASAFPTAGGLYHWASILGSRGWGWTTAWFNLLGLVFALAAINLGALLFLVQGLGPEWGIDWNAMSSPQRLLFSVGGMALITFSQALINHSGIRLTTKLTDFSGYWILLISTVLTIAVLVSAQSLEFSRLISFSNYSGAKGGDVWPATNNLWALFLMSFLLPAYTVTGFDASAHTSEETVAASRNVPLGIVRSVLVSGVAGWILLGSIVLSIRNMDTAAAQGQGAFFWIMKDLFSQGVRVVLFIAIVIAHYLCGLATVTSASRMTYAFARDGGLPAKLKWISPTYKTPVFAIWAVAGIATLFTIYTPVYEIIADVCALFLYVSYIIPIGLGLLAHGRQWTQMGDWDLGRWYKPFGVLSILGCAVLIGVGVQPPNDKAMTILAGTFILLAIAWVLFERRRFPGPPKVKGYLKVKIQ